MTPPKLNVLIFPCGSEPGLEIYQALRYSVHAKVFGASSVEDHGRFRFENYVGPLPNILDSKFDEAFLSVIKNLRIDVVFATHDSVQAYLGARAVEMGFFLVNGDPQTTTTTRRKSTTYRYFRDCEWTPIVFESISSIDSWPVVIKPDTGQGGQGVAIAFSATDAATLLTITPEPIIVEYLPGRELTVDCFTTGARNLRWIGPRSRERVRAGIAMRSSLEDVTPAIHNIACEINQRIHLRGPWFFQLKESVDSTWKLLEISSRTSGTMVAQRAWGINLPLMALHDYMERDVVALPNNHVKTIDRCLSTRAELAYEYDTVCVDLDDTLIVDGVANPTVLAFLYQSINQGKAIKLISRHAYDIGRTLENARIAPQLFDEIVQLSDNSSKADHVTSKSIFIDNHFPERQQVASRWNIPVFDVDALEFFTK